MFSRRLPADFSPNDLAERSARARRDGAVLIDLTVSNPTVIELKGVPPARFDPAPETGYDPDPAGSRPAREAVAAYYADRQVSVDPDDVVLTASTSEAYAHLFRLLGDPGDEFLTPAPSYPLFTPLADLECVTLRPYPLAWDGRWTLDVDAFRSLLAPRTRGIIIVNPNNPTGSFLNRAESDQVEAAALERDIPLIVDEVFGDFAFGPVDRRETFAGATRGLCFILSGLSKVAGLPQMKLAWIVVAGDPDRKRRAVEGLHWIADAFLSVGSPVQRVLPEWLEARQTFQAALSARTAANLSWLRDRLAAGSPVSLLPPQGGWSAVLRLPRTVSEAEWCLGLLERGVLIHPGHFYDFPEEAYAVVSLLPREAAFRAGIDRLLEFAAINCP